MQNPVGNKTAEQIAVKKLQLHLYINSAFATIGRYINELSPEQQQKHISAIAKRLGVESPCENLNDIFVKDPVVKLNKLGGLRLDESIIENARQIKACRDVLGLSDSKFIEHFDKIKIFDKFLINISRKCFTCGLKLEKEINTSMSDYVQARAENARMIKKGIAENTGKEVTNIVKKGLGKWGWGAITVIGLTLASCIGAKLFGKK